MSKQESAVKESKEPLLYNVTLTGRLRFLKTGSGKTLQQEWRNVFTGKVEWRDVEIVTVDNSQ